MVGNRPYPYIAYASVSGLRGRSRIELTRTR
ncbi:hypothetical protein TwortDSMZ_074 [Staphylococcus phage Twort]|uniref:Uncharacterized protein n=1 Tax=Staphylococcus phage Twort (strain DSM 17442 / HER 48) TaxID=2908167 RepID=A0A6H0X5M3_BPTWO|nr:hypothetical protein TwortDSMZ_074 [Staphylococcus phage Twort]